MAAYQTWIAMYMDGQEGMELAWRVLVVWFYLQDALFWSLILSPILVVVLPIFAAYFYMEPVTPETKMATYTNWFWGILKRWADLNIFDIWLIDRNHYFTDFVNAYNFGNALIVYWLILIPNCIIFFLPTVLLSPFTLVYWICQITYNIVYAFELYENGSDKDIIDLIYGVFYRSDLFEDIIEY